MCTLSEIKKVIDQAQSILIVAHIQPDGDTLGSCFALKNALVCMGKDADVCCDSAMPPRYAPLLEGQVLQAPDELEFSYTLAIAVDCADKARLGKAQKIFDKAKTTVNIDHHVTNEGFAQLNYIANVSSAGEIIYELMEVLGVPQDADSAKCLYIAISTDTGNFTYSNTSKKCMAYTAELVELFDLRHVADVLFRSRSLKLTQLIGRALSRLETHADGRIAFITLLLSDMKELDATGADCENIVDFAREINETKIAVFFRELEHGVKLSFRSKDDYDVCMIAMEYGGGGHKNASGACTSGKIDEIKKDILNKLTEIAQA